MRYVSGTWIWDIRVNPAIIAWRKECIWLKVPYYWKLNKQEAKDLCDLLAESYNIRPPLVKTFYEDSLGKKSMAVPGARGGLNGCYYPSQRTMYIHGRAHIKTVVHEFYHHLDCVTTGEFDSDDHPDGSRGKTSMVSLAWQFADRFWKALVDGQTGVT